MGRNMSSQRRLTRPIYRCVILLALLISQAVSSDVTADVTADVSGATANPGSVKIEWLRVLKVLGVAMAVTLITTLIAPLPIYMALWLCGCFKRHPHGAGNRRPYGEDHMIFCCLPRECSESQWGQPILYLGIGCLVGIPAGILAGWHSWPHV